MRARKQQRCLGYPINSLVKQREMPKPIPYLLVITLLAVSGCASVNMNPTTWENPLFVGDNSPVGTAKWWKQNRGKAEFVPGEGYRVAEVEGYFDQEGRPIQTKVAKTVKREESQGLLKDVNVSATMVGLKTQVGLGPDQQQAQLAFEKGEDLFQREKYSEAAKQFKETRARWPDSPLAQDAMFLMAESQFFNHDYSDAIQTYDELLAENPNSKHLDKVIRRQFDIARYWEQHHENEPHWPTTPNLFDDTRPLFDTLGRSLKVYENIRLNDPTGPLADDAIMATGNSYFLRGRYVDADYNYELIRSEYPRSEHQFEAHILGLQCKLRKYQGPDYDGTPLLEAKKLVKQIKVQFAGKLNEEERDRLDVDEAALQKQLAMRDWTRAVFYEENEQFGSAKFYYAKILRKFPNTPIANEAQQNYAALEGKPDSAPELLAGVIKWFPENAERKAIEQVPLLEPQTETLIARPPANTSGDGGDTVVR